MVFTKNDHSCLDLWPIDLKIHRFLKTNIGNVCAKSQEDICKTDKDNVQKPCSVTDWQTDGRLDGRTNGTRKDNPKTCHSDYGIKKQQITIHIHVPTVVSPWSQNIHAHVHGYTFVHTITFQWDVEWCWVTTCRQVSVQLHLLCLYNNQSAWLILILTYTCIQ